MGRSLLAAALSLIVVIAGCVQQPVAESVRLPYRNNESFIPLDAGPSILPVSTAAATPPPSTVLQPDREVRYLTLGEAIAIALEQGNVGAQPSASPGTVNDSLVVSPGRGISGSDSVRVLSLNPAIAGADVEASLAKFDARWASSIAWNTIDQPISTADQLLQAGNTGLTAINSQNAALSTSLIKPLPTGGVAGITFRTDYQFSNLPNPVNPSYRPALQFQFEQPLLRGFGVEINQLRSSHPGSLLTPFDAGGRVEGILLTRIRLDQQRAEFERNIQALVWNVEAAYWNLYAQYWNLYSREEALRQAHETWRVLNAQVGAGVVTPADEAQARGQFERFRNQRVQALGGVLEAERRLRGLLGLARVDARSGQPDDRRLVPADAPTLVAYQPDWYAALQEALAQKPELVLARQEVRARQMNLVNQRNQLLPDLRVLATYNVNGLGSRLDGPGDDNALRSLAQNRYQDWTLGLRMEVPLGFRDAHAGTRSAELVVAQALLTLKDQEEKVTRVLEAQYRQLFESAERIRVSRAQRQAYAEELELRRKEFQSGRNVALILLLEAQRFWADALTEESRAVVDYNTALAGFEFAKGTILQYENVVIGDGPLPRCARERAVDHERERSQAVVLRERAAPVQHSSGDTARLPQLPVDRTVSLPALLWNRPPVPTEIGPPTAATPVAQPH